MRFRAAWQSFFILVFAGYMIIWIVMPTKPYRTWTPKLNEGLDFTYFREQGINLVLFTFPIMLIAILGCVYLHLQKKSNPDSGRSSYLSMRRPALVMAPLGIVNFVELTFAAMFVVLLLWSLANYLYFSFQHLHLHKEGEKVWYAKFRSVSLRLAYIGSTCWAFLFFPVSRGSSILPLVGLTFESSIKYHIWLGHFSMALFTSHSIGFITYWVAMVDKPYLMLEWSSTYVSNVAGEIAFLVSLVIWATSIDRVRRRMFEVFFYSHHLYILFIFFYMLHVGVASLCMILPGIFLFLVDRYLRFLQSRTRTRLVSSRLLPNGTMELTFTKDPGLSYNTASILFLHVPSISRLQWHPFTIISSSNLERDTLSVLIKSHGNWTRELNKQLSSPLHRLRVSTEGPYEHPSPHFLNHDSLVMISGGSGIAPFISIIREMISRSTEPNTRGVPKVVLIAAFKKTADLAMLDVLLPLSATTSLDISTLQLKIEAYVTQEHEKGLEGTDHEKKMDTKLFKQNPSDSPISSVLGNNSSLWLGAIISSSFLMFLLLLAFVTHYHIHPVEERGEKYHYSYKILWDMFLVCASIFTSTSAIFLWQKRKISGEGEQIQHINLPSSLKELESLPHQSLAQSTQVHFGARPDLKRMLLDCKETDVGVVVCGPKGLRHEVAKICASDLAKNLCFESISFNW